MGHKSYPMILYFGKVLSCSLSQISSTQQHLYHDLHLLNNPLTELRSHFHWWFQNIIRSLLLIFHQATINVLITFFSFFKIAFAKSIRFPVTFQWFLYAQCYRIGSLVVVDTSKGLQLTTETTAIQLLLTILED